MVKRTLMHLVLAMAAMTVIDARAGEAAGGGFFFGLSQEASRIELPKAAQQRQQAQRAGLSGEDRARLLRQGFACESRNGRMGQANCAEQEEAARQELAERTRRNHEVAKERMGW